MDILSTKDEKLAERLEAGDPTIADRVFATLHSAILTLQMPPGAKFSEAEIARQLGVSRQPVREAFIRLAQIEFVRIQPKRATEVCKISEAAVLNARFIREALEAAVVRDACESRSETLINQLEDIIERQRKAVAVNERELFHDLDDAFHRSIAEGSGRGLVWTLINEQKAQMDRVRYLSLAFNERVVIGEHAAIIDALRRRDAAGAEAAMRHHLSRINSLIAVLRRQHPQYFATLEADG
ncbi:GntR family transcriptional regulator [Phyllobacterium salinisoli]|uniref:GntR family transcriptional regulator n=1 Tax=Phyllobacterium salinisoli TaxID=1899321 RepID=A0A368K2M6_9HYPH|nr:GntR family transcriptional regulator [Phyllobacterium salinisoli]RCS22230.1 GntR family transcriptional regulator [Phyllobacterium salinisoli]